MPLSNAPSKLTWRENYLVNQSMTNTKCLNGKKHLGESWYSHSSAPHPAQYPAFSIWRFSGVSSLPLLRILFFFLTRQLLLDYSKTQLTDEALAFTETSVLTRNRDG